MRYLAFGLVGIFAFFVSLAQPPEFKPDISRALFHTRLDESQQYLLASDGRKDQQLNLFSDEELNLQLTYHATTRIDQWQMGIEQSTTIPHQEKLRQLRAMTELLNRYTDLMRKDARKNKLLQWTSFPSLLDAYDEAVVLNGRNEAITPALVPLPYQIALLVTNSFAFADNTRLIESKQYLLLKYLGEHPYEILSQLENHPNYTYPFADSLLIVEAYRNPEKLITYAQASRTELSKKIRTVNHPLVKLISELSRDNKGQMYMPFLHQITNGTLTRSEIDAAVRDSSAYYSLLVKTVVENAGLIRKNEPVASGYIAAGMLKRKTMEVYVNTINGLHDSPAPVRFKSIQALNPQELYYLIVMNETEIYTSSYMYVYNRIFELLSSKSSDTLLQLVNYDRYKKFLTMASNYNTLDNFLGRMSRRSATTLMTDFVNNLDKGAGQDDIEDAVDVANAYAAIGDTSMRELMYRQVLNNLEIATANNNKKASIIYRLEKLIMESSNGGEQVNLSDSLGIQPIYTVKNDYLKDEKGRIVMQMYFYGDGAGKGSFNILMGLMGDKSQWQVTSTPQWVQWTSIGTAVPFVLFANRALDEDQDLDEKAQHALIDWMGQNSFNPTLTVHRGHSYYLKYTIEKMLPSSKVVVLGSCGAYHNLADVLEISPEAYIIASKQVGYGVINIQLFMYLINELKRGRDVIWPEMMNDVAKNVGEGRKSDFDDYIFPHRNLGAIFIKAYRKAMEEGGEGGEG
jgi:hypothetical protein